MLFRSCVCVCACVCVCVCCEGVDAGKERTSAVSYRSGPGAGNSVIKASEGRDLEHSIDLPHGVDTHRSRVPIQKCERDFQVELTERTARTHLAHPWPPWDPNPIHSLSNSSVPLIGLRKPPTFVHSPGSLNWTQTKWFGPSHKLF